MELDKLCEALSGVFYIATIEDDQPRVRPFDGAAIVDHKLYIGTNRHKNVFQQILKNPKIGIFEMEKGVARFTATATPVEDAEKNREIYDALQKEFTEDSVALELKNIKGFLQDTMGDKIELSIN